MSTRTRRKTNVATAWPGYVDILSALLMMVIFVLMVFIIAQFLLSQVLHHQNDELTKLNEQVIRLTTLLGLEKEKTLDLDTQIKALSNSISILSGEKNNLMAELEDYTTQAQMDRDEIKKQLLSIASLNEDIQALMNIKNELERKVGNLALTLSDRNLHISVLRDRSKALTTKLAESDEKTVLAQKEIKEQAIKIQALVSVVKNQKTAMETEKQLSADARAQVTLLNDQIQNLRNQLSVISQALSVTKTTIEDKDHQIDELGRKLNIALARRVNQLEQYQSEFFGRLRQVIGDNPAVKVQGDRFVFEAGLLFASGSVQLGKEGQKHLSMLADTLHDISKTIPEDLDWILRIDGHTDKVPIQNKQFSSNWDLSVARAVSVVRFLSRNNIPDHRMAAAGFGEYHPLDASNTPEAFRKNRRIEIKLTSK